jgi:hypothetical protein
MGIRTGCTTQVVLGGILLRLTVGFSPQAASIEDFDRIDKGSNADQIW